MFIAARRLLDNTIQLHTRLLFPVSSLNKAENFISITGPIIGQAMKYCYAISKEHLLVADIIPADLTIIYPLFARPSVC